MIKCKKVIFTFAAMLCLATSSSVTTFASSNSGYDRDAAVSYANDWAEDANPKYTNYIDQGGDCTNFVSQCLYAGGMSKSSTWKPNSSAWIDAKYFRNYWKDKDYDYRCYSVSTALHEWDTIYSLLWPGDIVQYGSSISSSSTTHSQIITDYDSSSKTTKFAQHSDSWSGFYKDASLKAYLYGRPSGKSFYLHIIKNGA